MTDNPVEPIRFTYAYLVGGPRAGFPVPRGYDQDNFLTHCHRWDERLPEDRLIRAHVYRRQTLALTGSPCVLDVYVSESTTVEDAHQEVWRRMVERVSA